MIGKCVSVNYQQLILEGFTAQSVFNLASLNGKNGFIINGIDLGDNAGYSVASAGDLNSGGKDAPNAGQAHVIYGEVFE